jgi:hypothetical protein
VLYVADEPECAVAEAFAQFRTWSDDMFAGVAALPASRRRLASYEMDTASCVDLDDGATLVRWGIRPSEVVTGRRSVSRAWALRIFEAGGAAGVSWWSYHNPDWHAHGVWDQTGVALVAIEDLQGDHPAVVAARAQLRRPWHRTGIRVWHTS